jgi:hypothetical protein
VVSQVAEAIARTLRGLIGRAYMQLTLAHGFRKARVADLFFFQAFLFFTAQEVAAGPT